MERKRVNRMRNAAWRRAVSVMNSDPGKGGSVVAQRAGVGIAAESVADSKCPGLTRSLLYWIVCELRIRLHASRRLLWLRYVRSGRRIGEERDVPPCDESAVVTHSDVDASTIISPRSDGRSRFSSRRPYKNDASGKARVPKGAAPAASSRIESDVEVNRQESVLVRRRLMDLQPIMLPFENTRARVAHPVGSRRATSDSNVRLDADGPNRSRQVHERLGVQTDVLEESDLESDRPIG
jgi:hypothetical protein